MKFIITRTYETLIEFDTDDYQQALKQLSEIDIYHEEMEQCCVIEVSVTDENGNPINDY